MVSGTDPFFKIPSPHVVSFIDNNQSVSVSGLLQSEINATNAAILTFNSGTYDLDLNVSSSPETIRVEIPHGAVVKDGNVSTAGAFEFRRRNITSVEEDLLAWYPMDDFNGSKIFDRSGRMRDGQYVSKDATSPGQGNITFSGNNHDSQVPAKAFDNVDNAANGRWLARQSDLPNIFVRYDFVSPVCIGSYRIVTQHYLTANRSPKSWRLEGSNDDSNWVVLDKVTNQTGWIAWESRTFDLNNTSNYRYYKIVFTEATGTQTYLGIAEIDLYPAPSLTPGKFGNALNLTDEYVDLPFMIDQGETSGMAFSAWIYPRKVDGGTDNERMIFGSDDGGWDWSMSIRTGSFSAWNGTTRFQSPLSLNANQWYHCVAVFDPISSRTTLHLNGGSITSNSLGLDQNSNLLRIGGDYANRTFDGLIDDIRIWGRPLGVTEVAKLWGNGMGDLGPKAKLEFDSIAWSNEISGKLILNQEISDWNVRNGTDI